MRLGYNTNGFAHHDLLAAIDVLAEIGYRGVAITLDHHSLNPFASDLSERMNGVRRRLERHGMASVIETGARYLLDARLKHEPTMVSPVRWDRERRIDFLRRAIEIAHALGSDCVSFWSGVVRDDVPDDEIWSRLADGLRPTLDHAARLGVSLAFEPEPGMFIDTMQRYDELLTRIDAPHFRLTLDVGHLHCLREWPLDEQIVKWGSRIANVHLEDMRAGVHEHLMFGEGEMDFEQVLGALAKINYPHGIYVELSRHSHEAPIAARKSFEFLSARQPRSN